MGEAIGTSMQVDVPITSRARECIAHAHKIIGIDVGRMRITRIPHRATKRRRLFERIQFFFFVATHMDIYGGSMRKTRGLTIF